MLVNDVQRLNACSPMLVTPFGIVILLNDVQFANVDNQLLLHLLVLQRFAMHCTH